MTGQNSEIESEVHWPEVLTDLLYGENMDRELSSAVMDCIFTGGATDGQVAAFLVALKSKGETSDEVLGMVEQMQAHAVDINVPGPILDVVGTGGDRSHSVNVSTMSAVVAAAAGATVVKHGNRASSSQCGSADVLEELGVVIDLPAAGVEQCVEQLGIGFCFAPVFHPAMRFAGPVRKQLGIPTVFNILGPLANPTRPNALLVGCADPRMAPIMAQVFADQGTSALVVRGDDGLDEATIFGGTQVWDASGSSGVARGFIDLEELGIQLGEPGSLRGGDAKYNAAVAREVLDGSKSDTLAPIRDAVALNTALALAAWTTVVRRDETGASASGLASNLDHVKSQLTRAYSVIDSGAPGQLLDRWVSTSQTIAKDSK